MSRITLVKYRLWALYFILLLLLGGCTSLFSSLDKEKQARHHIDSAEHLEKAGRLYEAAEKYAFIATEYPSSSWYYKVSVRKAGMLLCHPDNPNADIDASLHWFSIYENFAESAQEKENVGLLIKLLEQTKALQGKNKHLAAENSKLLSSVIELTEKLHVGKEEVEMMESELEQTYETLDQTQEALEKMKEVDIQIHKSKKE